MNGVQLTTQAIYVLAIAFAMIAAGVGKRRLEWRKRPRRRRRER